MSFGTNKPYAELHQKGGTVTRPPTTIRPKKAKALMFIGKQGLPIFRAKVELPAKDFKVPRRKMITWLPEDEQELERLMEEYMSKGIK